MIKIKTINKKYIQLTGFVFCMFNHSSSTTTDAVSSAEIIGSPSEAAQNAIAGLKNIELEPSDARIDVAQNPPTEDDKRKYQAADKNTEPSLNFESSLLKRIYEENEENYINQLRLIYDIESSSDDTQKIPSDRLSLLDLFNKINGFKSYCYSTREGIKYSVTWWKKEKNLLLIKSSKTIGSLTENEAENKMAVDDLDKYFSQYPFPFRRSTEIRNKTRNMIALNAFNNPSNDSFNFCGTNEKSSEIRRDVRIVRIGVNDLNPEIIVNTLNFDYDLGNRLRKSSRSRGHFVEQI